MAGNFLGSESVWMNCIQKIMTRNAVIGLCIEFDLARVGGQGRTGFKLGSRAGLGRVGWEWGDQLYLHFSGVLCSGNPFGLRKRTAGLPGAVLVRDQSRECFSVGTHGLHGT